MLVKKTVRNQITLPKAMVAPFRGVEYFDVSSDGESIVLRPQQKSCADEVRKKLAQLGIKSKTVKSAVCWARKNLRG